MSLIIAKQHGKKIFIESDSKVTSEEPEFNNPYLYGVLKSVVVSPEYVVCYAGIIRDQNGEYVSDAFNEIWELKKNARLDINAIVNVCVGANERSNGETDFIIASNSEPVELIKIDESGVHRGATSYWIGNVEGFEVFQRNFSGKFDPLSDGSKKLSNELSCSFGKVIEASCLSGIEGFQVGISNIEGFFEYSIRLDVKSQVKTVIQPRTSKATPFGEAADGSFAMSYFVSETKERPAIGVYFPQGHTGIFYYPEESSIGLKYTGLSDSEFVDSVKDQFGVVLSGFVVDLSKGRAKYIGKRKREFQVQATIKVNKEQIKST